MTAAPSRAVAVGTALAGGLLLAAAPTPAAALRSLTAPATAGDPTAPLVALLSLSAWALAGWLALTIAMTAGGHLPGRLGRALAALARHLAPATVRRTVEVALGLTVAVGVLGASPAAAAPGGAPALDWGAVATTAETPPAPVLDWSAPPVPAPPAPDPAASPMSTGVVVQPGDSLWRLAEQDLATTTGTTPSEAEVAQAWPTWWAANREAVGADPDLLQPGTRLAPPPSDSTPPNGTPPADPTS